MNSSTNFDSDMNSSTIYSGLPVYYKWIKYTLLYCVVCSIIAGNLLTLIAINKTKKLRVIPTNMFIASLAASDAMIGFLAVFVITFHFSSDDKLWPVWICTVTGSYFAVFAISLHTLLAIAIDRYLAIVHPLSYRMKVTTKRAIIICVLIWIIQFSFIEVVTCFYGSRAQVKEFYLSTAHVLYPKELFFVITQNSIIIPIGGNILLYLLIFFKLLKKNVVGSTARSHGEGEADTRNAKRQKVFAKMMAFVLGYLLLACMPYYILVSLYDVTDPTAPAWFVYAFDLSTVLFYSNSFMNPVIYGWQSREFRQAYKMVCGYLRHRSTGASVVTQSISCT